MLPSIRMGVDIGGTKIAAIALDAKTGQALKQSKIATPDGYDSLLSRLSELVASYEAELGPVTFGMCYPGSVNHDSLLVQNANILWLNDKPFEQDLAKALHKVIRTGNDANCFTLSEAIDGAGCGHSVVFGATLGTGLGGGIVIDQKILVGLNKLSGEWGHVPLPWPTEREISGPECYCGLKGCLETYLSGTGLARSYRHVTGKDIRAEEVVKLANNGDAEAEAALSRYENRMARACAMIINILDPDVIVLGGGLSALKRLYTNIPKQWDQYVFSPQKIKTQLVQAQHGGESGMRGAAMLWSEPAAENP
ncbi:MAG: ROK family protein [Gammaproteobacteria bacterium]|nr:ROK family protein [Gammaproteobacteria bacterium]